MVISREDRAAAQYIVPAATVPTLRQYYLTQSHEDGSVQPVILQAALGMTAAS